MPTDRWKDYRRRDKFRRQRRRECSDITPSSGGPVGLHGGRRDARDQQLKVRKLRQPSCQPLIVILCRKCVNYQAIALCNNARLVYNTSHRQAPKSLIIPLHQQRNIFWVHIFDNHYV